MDFVRSHFGKMQLWQVEHFFLHKKVPVVLYRYLFVKKKVFNWSGLHFSEVTSYKIHTLTCYEQDIELDHCSKQKIQFKMLVWSLVIFFHFSYHFLPFLLIFRSFGQKLFHSFLGIPYAKPPIGIHRFNYTEPIEPWNGVFAADKHISCLQVSLDF